MGWKPLPADVPLDQEALAPPTDAIAVDPALDPTGELDEQLNPPQDMPADGTAPPQFAELPADVPLDEEALAGAPGIAAAPTKEAAPLEAKNATPMVTEEGFADTMVAPKVHRAALDPEELAEYEGFFQDPSKPPNPEALRKWFHDKTGAYMGNADQIVEHFKKTGQYNTHHEYSLPTESMGAGRSFSQHAANSLLGDWGAGISAPFDALGLGTAEDRPNVWNSDASFGQLVDINADLTDAQLERDTQEHPWASIGGEIVGLVPAAVGGGAVANLARVGKLGNIGSNAAKAVAGGAIYGSGAAGPGERLKGAAIGASVAPLVGLAAAGPAMAYRGARSVFQGAPGAARKVIARAIKDDANTPESVGQQMMAAADNDVPMALADTGPNMRGLLAASTRTGGLGRTVARDALETRQNQLADRVVGHIERDLGPIANPHKVADEQMTQARNKAAPLYEAFYAQPALADPAIDALLSRPSMQKALRNAYNIAKEEGRDPEALGFRLGDDGNIVLERGPTLTAKEAQRANPNRFEPAEVPDEFDELRVRTVTTKNGRKVKMRGPIDMTQRLRMMGGIQDQGGELRHGGITNKPRKMDFGKNEQFLGNLVDNERGMTFDDAAHALWEDGYFPDLDRRPTINEFLDRLRDEADGTARYFDPADSDELNNFHSAQAQRYGAEEAANSGAPLADDMTVPADTMDDLIKREGPPARGRDPLREKVYTPQTLDYVKRGMDDVVEGYRDSITGRLVLDTEGRAVNNTLRQFLEVADKRYPDWKAAREAYAGHVKGVSAMNEGRKALRLTADDLEARIRDMSPFEKEMYALGARRAMAELVRTKGDTADVVHALVGTGKKRAMLARLFGDRKQFDRFVETLSQEREGWRSFRKALLGSDTAGNIQDDAALEIAVTGAELMTTGVPFSTAVRKASQFVGRKLSEKTKEQLAAVLSNTDPAALNKLAVELADEARKRGIKLKRRGTVTRQVGKGAAIYSQQPSQ